MNTDIVPTWPPRVLGGGAGWGATKIAEKTGIVVDPATLVAVGLFAYSAVHRWLSAHLNPGDTAKRELIAPDKAKVERIKTEAAA